MTQTTIRTVCPHDCPDQCSIIATVEDGRLVGVAGDADHPFTRGYLCGKVARYEERVYSPERLLTPLRRVGAKGAGEFAPLTWDEALGEIAERWRAAIAEYGSEALLGYAYSGNMGVVNRNTPRALFHALGATRMLAGTVCDSTCGAGWSYAVGDIPGTDPETVTDSDLVLSWGANLATTNVHLVPLVDEARDKGAQLVVIDPYRTRTARRADWHIAPRVGTDAALALGMMHVIVREGLHDADFVRARGVGFDLLCEDVLPEYGPERVAAITGVPVEDVERLGRMYGRARAPFLRLGMGFSRHAGGGMAVRTIACLPALVGAWGKPGGGALLDTAHAWELDYDALRRPDFLPRPTREVNHSALGRALLELTDPPIMALFVASNNPAVSCPDQGRVRAGLSREDLFTVVHDAFLSDTARYADIVLPACMAVETEDLYRSYGTYYAQHGPALIEPLGESRSNVWVVQELARRLGLTDPFFALETREYMDVLLAGARGPSAALCVEGLVGAGPVKLAYPNDGPATTFFYSEAMAREGLPPLPGWEPDPEAEAEGERWPLRLLTAPGHFQHHTSFAGVARLRRREGAAACLLHPADAESRGIRDGAPVLLHNDRGEVGLYARVTADTQPGVVTVEGGRSRAAYLHGGPLNVLTSDRLSDMGAGATYQSTWLDARPLETEHP
ncbi:MAG: molybdopterin-containing oxidoreductase family protein [Dehalococcoidia bacterium]